jgi:hypothetical protein
MMMVVMVMMNTGKAEPLDEFGKFRAHSVTLTADAGRLQHAFKMQKKRKK